MSKATKERLWKELQTNPKDAFDELLRELIREDSFLEIEQLEDLASEHLSLWSSLRGAALRRLNDPKRTVPLWVEAYGVLSKKKSSKVHLIDSGRYGITLCGTDAFHLQYHEEIPSGKEVCLRCMQAPRIQSKPPPLEDNLCVANLWSRVMGNGLHLLDSRGKNLCTRSFASGGGLICLSCAHKVKSFEQFRLEYKLWKSPTLFPTTV